MAVASNISIELVENGCLTARCETPCTWIKVL